MRWKITVPSLKAFYEKPADEAQREWRRIGAIEKAKNVIRAIEAAEKKGEINVRSILEVGAGTGAVMENINRTRRPEKLNGIEVGEWNAEGKGGALDASPNQSNLSYYDGKNIPFENDSYDFVYATHVLEHVVDERAFLHEMRRVSKRWVYVEVPCEITLRTSPSALQSTLNIGHINPYTPETFALRLETSGLRVHQLVVRDVSLAVLSFHRSKIRAMLIHVARRLALALGERLASRLFVYHACALCEKAEIIDIDHADR